MDAVYVHGVHKNDTSPSESEREILNKMICSLTELLDLQFT